MFHYLIILEYDIITVELGSDCKGPEFIPRRKKDKETIQIVCSVHGENPIKFFSYPPRQPKIL